jgi:hypothetical protein
MELSNLVPQRTPTALTLVRLAPRLPRVQSLNESRLADGACRMTLTSKKRTTR